MQSRSKRREALATTSGSWDGILSWLLPLGIIVHIAVVVPLLVSGLSGQLDVSDLRGQMNLAPEIEYSLLDYNLLQVGSSVPDASSPDVHSHIDDSRTPSNPASNPTDALHIPSPPPAPSAPPSPSRSPSPSPPPPPPAKKELQFWVINLEGSTHRMESVRSQFESRGMLDRLHRFATTRVLPPNSPCAKDYEHFRYLTPEEQSQIRLPPQDMFAGTVGTFISHYQLWLQISKSTEPVVVLEDDAKLTYRFDDALEMLENFKDEFEYVNIGVDGGGASCYYGVPNPVKSDFNSRNGHYDLPCVRQPNGHGCGNFGGGNIAYYLTPAGAQKLLNFYSERLMFQPADWFIIEYSNVESMQGCKWRAMVPGGVERVASIGSDRLEMGKCRL